MVLVVFLLVILGEAVRFLGGASKVNLFFQGFILWRPSLAFCSCEAFLIGLPSDEELLVRWW